MTKEIKAFERDAIYIRQKHLTEERKKQIRTRYSKHFFGKEDICTNCEYLPDRVSDICLECANYKGQVKLYSIVQIKERSYVRLPYGDRAGIQRIFGPGLKFVQCCPALPMTRPIKFTGTLKEHQIPVTNVLMRDGRGVLKSPPRSGKTVMSTHTICSLGQKTIIMAGQKEWLDNFYETFVGSDTQEGFTNIKPSRIGFARKLEDFEKFDVCLVTYQTFISEKGQKLLEKVRRMFPVMVIDEVQGGNAHFFSSVISKFVCKYKFGLSGTPERKDQKEWIIEKLLGPIIHDVKVPMMVPRVEVVRTNLSGKMPSMWTYMVNRIEGDPKRMELIAKEALKRAKQGHLVLIPMARVAQINKLTKLINDLSSAKRAPAVAFYGGVHKLKRRKVITDARDYKVKIIVGNIRLLSVGVNIPRASCLFEVTPSSNMPNAKQRFSRILTPLDGKPQPVVVYFLDNVDVRRSCMRTEFFQVMLTKFRPLMDGPTKADLYSYLNKEGKRPRGLMTRIGAI